LPRFARNDREEVTKNDWQYGDCSPRRTQIKEGKGSKVKV